MKSAGFAYHRPAAVAEAVEMLGWLAPEGGRVLAGGQSLLPLMALRLAQPGHLIDINRVPFGAMRMEGGALVVPAGVRHEAMRAAPGPLGAVLGTVAGHIAHLPIRSRGTVCGSLAHADPAAEWPLVFATLGGEAVVRSSRGERRIAAGELVRDVMTTALAEDELLLEARIAVPDGARFGFHEISRRAGDYAMAMAFVAVTRAAGRVTAARVGVGGAEGRPRRIGAAEAVLLDGGSGEAAAEAAAGAIEPMVDEQIDAGLRRALVRTAVRRALAA